MDIVQIIAMLVAFGAVIYTIASEISKATRPHDKQNKGKDDDSYFDLYDELKDEEKSEPDTLYSSDDMEDEPLEEKNDNGNHNGHKNALKRNIQDRRRPEQPSKHWSWKEEDTKYTFQSRLEGYRAKTSIEERSLHVQMRSGDDLVSSDLKEIGGEGALHRSTKKPKVCILLSRLPSKKMLVISHEILSRPRGLQGNTCPYN